MQEFLGLNDASAAEKVHFIGSRTQIMHTFPCQIIPQMQNIRISYISKRKVCAVPKCRWASIFIWIRKICANIIICISNIEMRMIFVQRINSWQRYANAANTDQTDSRFKWIQMNGASKHIKSPFKLEWLFGDRSLLVYFATISMLIDGRRHHKAAKIFDYQTLFATHKWTDNQTASATSWRLH